VGISHLPQTLDEQISSSAGSDIKVLVWGLWRAARGRTVDLGRSGSDQGVPQRNLPLVIPGGEQKSFAAMVRHEDLWQPGKGEALLP